MTPFEYKENIKKQILNSYIQKSNTGEGSRGGHVVGHTSTGKAIYQSRYIGNAKQLKRKEDYLNSKIRSHGSVMSMREHLDKIFDEGFNNIIESEVHDKAKSKKLNSEYLKLARTAPIGNENHPETKRLRELQRMPKSPYDEREIMIKKKVKRLSNSKGAAYDLSPFDEDYINEKIHNQK